MSHSASSPKRWERWKLLGTTSPTATRPPAALNTSAISHNFSEDWKMGDFPLQMLTGILMSSFGERHSLGLSRSLSDGWLS